MASKTYLRYAEGPMAGVYSSPASLQVASGVLEAGKAPVLFLPSLECVRVYGTRTGDLQYALLPADAKLPMEVTALRLFPLESGTSDSTVPFSAVPDLQQGWMLAVGYSNGHVACFTCAPTNHYGKPVCRFYALGHKPTTNVLSLAVDARCTMLCSAGQDTDITVWEVTSHDALYRLRGHRGAVVALHFLPGNDDLLLSGSADGLIKLWNLNVKQCIQTIVASDAQVTSLLLDASGKRLYCGLRESIIKCYNLDELQQTTTIATGMEVRGEMVPHGSIPRKHHKPVNSMAFSPDYGMLLLCTGTTLEFFRVCSAEEVKKRAYRKRKRQQKTTGTAAVEEAEGAPTEGRGAPVRNGDDGAGSDGEEAHAMAAAEISHVRSFFLEKKIRGACFLPVTAAKDQGALLCAVTFNDNSVRTYRTTLTTSDLEGTAMVTLTDLKTVHTLDQHGHQSDVKSLLFVDNDSTLLSLSAEKLLQWHVRANAQVTQAEEFATDHDYFDAQEANLARLPMREGLNCSGFVPLENAVCAAAISSNLCCVGQADGSVLLLDVAASDILSFVPSVHLGGVRSVTKIPGDGGFATIGADRRLVLWTLVMDRHAAASATDEPGKKGNRRQPTSSSAAPPSISLLQTQELELSELPLFVRFSPDHKFLAIGLQNNNIQLFYGDTLKPFLVLYGHKLPPTDIAFSSDATLAASVGMDKSLRFWGTDFGDCHRAIHAHDDYVTSIAFVADTHYVFTASMDGSVKHWDGDTWTMIQQFRLHPHGLWAVALSTDGTCAVVAGVDKYLRVMFRTEEMLFPEEEDAKSAQRAMDEANAAREAMQKLDQSNAEVGIAGQKTSATSEAAENLMEALDVVSIELQRLTNKSDTTGQRNPIFGSKTVWQYLWSVVESIRPSELRHALSSLTSLHVEALLNYLEKMLEEKAVLNFEIASKLLLALVCPMTTHAGAASRVAIAGEISESEGARRLRALRLMISQGLDRNVSTLDYGIAGLQFVQRHLEQSEKIRFFDLSKVQGYKKKYHSRALQ